MKRSLVPNVVLLRAYVDFVSSEPLLEVGEKISEACFGGGDFVGENEGIWDEIPAVRLNREPLGLEITLGLIRSIEHDLQFARGTDTLVVDLAGMSAINAERVKAAAFAVHSRWPAKRRLFLESK